MEKKYKLSEVTSEEQEAFMKDFEAFLNERSLYFEPVPEWTRKDLQSPWTIRCSIFLQKKTLIPDVQEGAVASTNPEVNPTV